MYTKDGKEYGVMDLLLEYIIPWGIMLTILFGIVKCSYNVVSTSPSSYEVNQAGRSAFDSAVSCTNESVSGCYQFERDQKNLKSKGYELQTGSDGVTRPHWVGK